MRCANNNAIVAVLNYKEAIDRDIFLHINNINYYNLPVTDTMFASGLNDSVKSESSFAIAYQTNYQKTKLMLWQGITSILLAGIQVNWNTSTLITGIRTCWNFKHVPSEVWLFL